MGWQKIPKCFCAYSCFIFLVLIGILTVSSIFGDFFSTTIVFHGECSMSKTINLYVHLAVTALAVGVTQSSDAFLNLVLALQPDDIRKAHANSKWVEIGVNSWRNLRFAGPWRWVCWVLLLLSSLPIQLLVNAAVFHVQTNTDYRQITVSQGFLDGGPWQVPGIASLLLGVGWVSQNQSYHNLVMSFQEYSRGSNWTELDSMQCQKTYLDAMNGLQEFRNLIVVIEAGPDPNAIGWTGSGVWNNSIPLYYANISTEGYDPQAINTLWSISYWCTAGATLGSTWNICSGGLGQPFSLFDSSPKSDFSGPWKWNYVETISDNPRDVPGFSEAYIDITGLFCLAEPFTSPCKVEVTNGFVLAVCLCVLVKSSIAVYILRRTRHKKPILTLGDMIQDQLEDAEDGSTVGMSTFSQDWFRSLDPAKNRQDVDDMLPHWNGKSQIWRSQPKRRWKAVPQRVWWATYISISSVLLTVLVILGIAFRSYSGAVGGLHDIGFGDNPQNFKVHLFNDRVSGAIVANLPQSILTACFFWFKALYARMFQARDWAKFVTQKDGQKLRVTEPQEPQPERLKFLQKVSKLLRSPWHWCVLLWFKLRKKPVQKHSQKLEPYQDGSYILGIPIGWGILFLACSTGLHWAIGQSLYQVASETLPSGPDDTLASPLQFEIGFSVQAILVTLGLAVLTVVIPVALSCWKLPDASIIVGTNSAAISAQCHAARRRVDVQDGQVTPAVAAEPEASGGVVALNDENQSFLDAQGIQLGPVNPSSEQRHSRYGTMTQFTGRGETDEDRTSTSVELACDDAENVAAAGEGDTSNNNNQSPTNEDVQNDTPYEAAEEAPLGPNEDKPWLVLLKWGVLVQGSTDNQRPGLLGLAPTDQIISPPIVGHYYK